MSSLRERQRTRRKQAIIDAAEQLFSERGYSAVRVEEIALRAEVGVATVYKYFGTKAGLIRELWRAEVERVREAGERVLADPPEDPARGFPELMDQYRFGDRWQNRDHYRAIGGLRMGYEKLFEGLREKLDEVIHSQIQSLVRHYARRGRMAKSVRAADISAVLYAIHTYHLQDWAMRDDVSLAQTRRDMKRQVASVFRPWIVG